MLNYFKALLDKLNIILIFFMVIFCFTLTSFVVFKPIAMNSTGLEDSKELPALELSNFNLKEIDKDMVFMDINGGLAKQFSDREIFEDFHAKKIDSKNQIEILKGKSTLHKGNNYYFPNGVNYTKGDDIKFFSTRGTYNLEKETFTGLDEFSLDHQSTNTIGLNIFYDKKNDIITARNVKSSIYTKGK